jgi:hypothetical protein
MTFETISLSSVRSTSNIDFPHLILRGENYRDVLLTIRPDEKAFLAGVLVVVGFYRGVGSVSGQSLSQFGSPYSTKKRGNKHDLERVSLPESCLLLPENLL